jgi:hypothetical protein
MRTLRAVIAVCLLALPAAPAFAKKKIGFMKKPGTALMQLSVVTPAEGCSNWAWAAATQSILAMDEIALDHRELIQKTFGGELCLDGPLDLKKMGDAVSGEYVLGPKRKMKVVSRVFPAGAIISPEEIIAAIQRKRPMILFWKSRAYVAVGAAYTEWIGPQGARLWEIHELTLLDPVAQSTVTFQRGRDDMSELNGAMQFVLFPMQEIDWVPTVATPR